MERHLLLPSMNQRCALSQAMKRRRSYLAMLAAVSCWDRYYVRTVHSFDLTRQQQLQPQQPSQAASSRYDIHWRSSGPLRSRCYLTSSNNILNELPVDINESSSLNNLPRIFVNTTITTTTTTTPSSLTTNAIIPLTPNQANYLSVMRITNSKRWGPLAGHLRLFNGQDGEWLAKVILITGDEGHMGGKKQKQKQKHKNNRKGTAPLDDTVVECLVCLKDQSMETSLPIHLHLGRLKKPRRKWVLEKVTELGIQSIYIVDTEHSAMMDPWEYDKHWLQVREAAEQCERLTVPTLSEHPMTWDSMLDQIAIDNDDDDDQWLVCRERSPESIPLWQALSSQQQEEATSSEATINYHVLVGPEGGWSQTELDGLEQLRRQRPQNVHFVSLGSLVLRAETAAIAAISAVALAQDSTRILPQTNDME